MPRARQEQKAGGRCPICNEPTETDFRPFCSARCRDIDLSRWLRGGYAIAGGQAGTDEDGEEAAARHARAQPAGAEDGDRAEDDEPD